MTRDYAKRRSRSQARSAAPKSQVPGWVWLFTGSVLGAFVMFLVYLAGIPPQPVTIVDQLDEVSKNLPRESQAAPAVDEPDSQPRFDFYQLLKQSEVTVDPAPLPREDIAREDPEKIEYVLQVGSFKNPDDADRLRAQLLLLNLDASVETVKVRNAETWHRVLVGPFPDRGSMNKARGTLADNKMTSLLLKRSAEG